MIHRDKDEFLKILERTSAQSGFSLRLLEKDYYLTILLGSIHQLSENLIFKGGTCLNKVYYPYYRLSEDLDFTLIIPAGRSTRTVRRNAIKAIKESLVTYVSALDLIIENIDQAGHRESTQYAYVR
jgi:predicted nucleotidyltransferase component of viral defense system